LVRLSHSQQRKKRHRYHDVDFVNEEDLPATFNFSPTTWAAPIPMIKVAEERFEYLESGRWKVCLHRALGGGSFGSVFRAFDLWSSETRNDAAVKRLPVATQSEYNAFMAEVEILERVGAHASVVQIHNHLFEHNAGWIFLQMATGCELFERVSDLVSISTRTTWSYFHPLVSAVRHCHERGVVHRNIKLENVMIDQVPSHRRSSPGVLLVDFGHALLLPTRADGIVNFAPKPISGNRSTGVQAYRAPEVADGDYYPAKTDVWALGVLLFATIAGFFPFREADESDWRFAHIKKAQMRGEKTTQTLFELYRRPCPFEPAVCAVIDACLDINMEERCTVFDLALMPWVKNAPTPMETPPNINLDQGDALKHDVGMVKERPDEAPMLARQKKIPFLNAVHKQAVSEEDLSLKEQVTQRATDRVGQTDGDTAEAAGCELAGSSTAGEGAAEMRWDSHASPSLESSGT